MKKPLQSSIIPWSVGVICAALSLASCQKADSDIDALAMSNATNQPISNQSIVDAGAITEQIEMNKTCFNADVTIFSVRDAALTKPTYEWQVYKNNNWVKYDQWGTLADLQFYNGNPAYGRTSKFRRMVQTPSGPAYSNECTIINYAFQEDPRWGTDMYNNAAKLGPYSDDFSESLLFDTRGEYFRDHDYMSYHGNDAFIRLELTRGMLVEILTGATPMFVRLQVSSDQEPGYLYDENSSRALVEASYGPEIPFPAFDQENPCSELVFLALNPGTYLIQVQGSKASNAGAVSAPIYISMRGTLMPN